MPNSREIVEDMMSAVYREAPRSWPNGLCIESFVPRAGESVYLVRTKSASTPIGFVGWQVRREGGQRVGYYTVGLMPEHRGKGYAKEAVQKLISIKSAGVDTVKALIQKDNAPSIALAEAIGVSVTKVASLLSAAGKVNEAMPAVQEAAGRLNKALPDAQASLRQGAFIGSGALAGHTLADFILAQETPRNKRLKIIAALLGGAGGAAIEHGTRNN
jgi:GNAT superfamily N-acetyltransferase